MGAEIHGLDLLIGRVDVMRRRIARPEPALRESVTLALGSIERNFEAEGRPKWAPLKPSTLKHKGGRGSILTNTGRMRRSNQAQIGNRGWTIRNRAPYSKYTLGTSRMPAREFLVHQPEDVPMHGDIFTTYFYGR